jgi:dTDP-4-amino-4,6-dideoxygalactose transaminase
MYKNTEQYYSNNNDFVELFEKRLCEYTGAPYAVAVDRCTNAILLCLEYFGEKEQQLVLPKRTYQSVPMTLIRHGYAVCLTDIEWVAKYRIGATNIYDCAVGFDKGMYNAGEIQCLSFQQKKRLSIGKGGAVLLDDADMYRTLKRLRHDGRDSSKPVIDEDPNDFILGFHMYMSPDEAAKGVLLLNQLQNCYVPGSHNDYPDMSTFKVLRNYTKCNTH